jgi:hypothetical protein
MKNVQKREIVGKNHEKRPNLVQSTPDLMDFQKFYRF